MRSNRLVRVLKVVIFFAAVLALLTFVVMRLWNWLTPALFGWHTITFWQALGIIVLSKILFCGFRPGQHHREHWAWKRRMFERWESMTPEEREKFKQAMRGGRCGFGGPEAEEKKS